MQTEQEKQLAELIVESLNLEDVSAEEIQPEDPLFGEGLGLGFDRCSGTGPGHHAKVRDPIEG